MLAQETWDVPPSTLVQAPIFQPQLRAEQSWRLLPIPYLHNFERITGQFASFGLHFENVIAFFPSNPRFLNEARDKVLMPAGQSKSLKVSVEATVSHIHLWMMGSQEITVSLANANENPVSVTETSRLASTDIHEPYAEQNLTIETRTAKTLCLHSKAPFVVTRFAVKQQKQT